jgi:hypothetical protein
MFIGRQYENQKLSIYNFIHHVGDAEKESYKSIC